MRDGRLTLDVRTAVRHDMHVYNQVSTLRGPGFELMDAHPVGAEATPIGQDSR